MNPTGGEPSTGGRHRVLLIDDDLELCSLLEEYLAQEGFDVVSLHHGTDVLRVLEQNAFHAAILDVTMPGPSGLDVLRALRPKHSIPVLMLTARGDEVDRIVGLELGADDYLAKPFNIRELVARMRAVLRRVESSRLGSGTLSLGDLVLDRETQRAAIAGDPVEVTGAEFRILEMLMTNAGEVVSRDQLVQAAVGRSRLPWDRTIDTHISNLRRKLCARNSRISILSVRGIGYRVPR
jgi:two-component system response regulator CpxR